MISGPMQLCFLLGGSEDGASISTTRSRAFEVGIVDFALGHQPGGRATNILGRTVAATHLVRIDDFFTQSARLFTARTDRDYVETHGLIETFNGRRIVLFSNSPVNMWQ